MMANIGLTSTQKFTGELPNLFTIAASALVSVRSSGETPIKLLVLLTTYRLLQRRAKGV
jgi:hypothetical protein